MVWRRYECNVKRWYCMDDGHRESYVRYYAWCIEAETKWPPCSRRHFLVHFLMKIHKFRFRFHWSLFPMTNDPNGTDQATISHYLNQRWVVHCAIYAPLRLTDLNYMHDPCKHWYVHIDICDLQVTNIHKHQMAMECKTTSRLQKWPWLSNLISVLRDNNDKIAFAFRS